MESGVFVSVLGKKELLCVCYKRSVYFFFFLLVYSNCSSYVTILLHIKQSFPFQVCAYHKNHLFSSIKIWTNRLLCMFLYYGTSGRVMVLEVEAKCFDKSLQIDVQRDRRPFNGNEMNCEVRLHASYLKSRR